MSFELFWDKLDSTVARTVQEKLNKRFKTMAKPDIIGDLEIADLDFGSVAPQVEILDITDPFPEFYYATDSDVGDPDYEESLTFEHLSRTDLVERLVGESSRTIQEQRRVVISDERLASEVTERLEAWDGLSLGGNSHRLDRLSTTPNDSQRPFRGDLFGNNRDDNGPKTASFPISVSSEVNLGNSSRLSARRNSQSVQGDLNNNTVPGSVSSELLESGGLGSRGWAGSTTTNCPGRPSGTLRSLSERSVSRPGSQSTSASRVYLDKMNPGVDSTSSLHSEVLTHPPSRGKSTSMLSSVSSSSRDAGLHSGTFKPASSQDNHGVHPDLISSTSGTYRETRNNPSTPPHLTYQHLPPPAYLPTSEVSHPPHSFSTLSVERQDTDTQVILNVSYKGNMSVTIKTSLRINYPSPAFIELPVVLKMTGFDFSASVIVAFLKHRINFCFMEPEDPSQSLLSGLYIRSEIGDQHKHILKNVEKIEKFVVEQLRKVLDHDFIFPSYHSIELDDSSPY
ncbi:Mitochondrial distribution and morphology protein 12 [Dispira simplex]|nr:Mitochondrial distribution and morphology protein 12 [Dispira simplex]